MRHEALQGLEPACVIVGSEEQLEVCRQLLMIGLVVSLDGRILDGAVHPLDLTIDPGVVRHGEPVLDAALPAEPIKQVHAEPRPWGQINSAAGDRTGCRCPSAPCGYTIWHGLDDGIQERHGALPVGSFRRACNGKLRGSVDGNKQIEHALACTHLGDVEVNKPDWMALELPPARFVTLDLGEARDAMALQAAVEA